MGNKRVSFSDVGRQSRVRRAGPQFKGVLVSVTKPAYCNTHKIFNLKIIFKPFINKYFTFNELTNSIK